MDKSSRALSAADVRAANLGGDTSLPPGRRIGMYRPGLPSSRIDARRWPVAGAGWPGVGLEGPSPAIDIPSYRAPWPVTEGERPGAGR
jgi:hypothetical protein